MSDIKEILGWATDRVTPAPDSLGRVSRKIARRQRRRRIGVITTALILTIGSTSLVFLSLQQVSRKSGATSTPGSGDTGPSRTPVPAASFLGNRLPMLTPPVCPRRFARHSYANTSVLESSAVALLHAAGPSGSASSLWRLLSSVTRHAFESRLQFRRAFLGASLDPVYTHWYTGAIKPAMSFQVLSSLIRQCGGSTTRGVWAAEVVYPRCGGLACGRAFLVMVGGTGGDWRLWFAYS
jgi:hypothetical protein